MEIVAGVIGLGVGLKHAYNLLSIKKVKLKKICDFRVKKKTFIKNLEKISYTKNANDIFNDKEINLVIIASYDNFHYEHIIKSLKNNKHVFCEKPICLFRWQLINIKKILNKNKHLFFECNFVLNQIDYIKKLILLSKKIGKIYYFEGDYNYGRLNKLNDGWRGKIPYYSVTLGGGVHIVDLMSKIIKEPIIKINNFSNKICSKGLKFRYKDFVLSVISFQNKAIAKITSNFGSVTPHHHRISIYGTKGTLYLNERHLLFYKKNSLKSKYIILNKSNAALEKAKVLKNFVKNIISDKDNNLNKKIIKDLINTMEICFEIDKAVKKNL